MQGLKARSSEIVLVVMLVLLCACIRVYYGGEQVFMIVWKGEVGFADTVVSLEDMLKMPRADLLARHRSVFFQLEDMGFLDESHEQMLEYVRRKQKRNNGRSPLADPGAEKPAVDATANPPH